MEKSKNEENWARADEDLPNKLVLLRYDVAFHLHLVMQNAKCQSIAGNRDVIAE